MRFAFVTHEFISERAVGGGLGSYIHKMCRALTQAGHVCEVFVLSFVGPETIEYDGLRVHRVHPQRSHGFLKWAWHAPAVVGMGNIRRSARLLSGAKQLAQALESRDAQAPFDAVHSADCEAPGWYIRPRRDRVHIVRGSFPIELYAAIDDHHKPLLPRWRSYFEVESMRRAPVAYAPSKLAAEYYRQRVSRPVHVVRPPAVIEHLPSATPPDGLPEKYLIHYGQLRARKGTEWIARALPLAWRQEKDLRLVMAGPLEDFHLDGWRERWGELGKNVIYCGPLDKPAMYAAILGSGASALPSLVDNLPNTVIESLRLGVPVIGTRGASIDELVEQDKTGELVPVNDDAGLAAAMVRVWRGESKAKKGFVWDSEIARQMQPEIAVAAFLDLMKLPK
jgi:glycogen synthase